MFEFNLPSDPSKVVRLREITVADAMDFSDVDPDFEEEATSLFLEKAQEKETYSDPREWTGDDRRYALFLYHVNTTKFPTVPLTFTCAVCGEEHTCDVSLRSILETYKPIEGANFREFPFQLDGETTRNVVVRPWTGADLEAFEKMSYQARYIERELEAGKGSLSPKEQKKLQQNFAKAKSNAALFYLVSSLDVPSLDEKGTKASRRPLVMDAVKSMPFARFSEFVERVKDVSKEMEHGLNTAYEDGKIQILIPDVKCDDAPDKPGTLLRWPFRFVEIIPAL